LNRHKFTRDESRKGGWARARQAADLRRQSPSLGEAVIRSALDELGLSYVTEYEFWNGPADMYQWIDVLVQEPKFAIEVDGSKDWHGQYSSSKMHKYDKAKKKWLKSEGIPLLNFKYSSAVTIEDATRELLSWLNENFEWERVVNASRYLSLEREWRDVLSGMPTTTQSRDLMQEHVQHAER